MIDEVIGDVDRRVTEVFGAPRPLDHPRARLRAHELQSEAELPIVSHSAQANEVLGSSCAVPLRIARTREAP